MKRAPKRCGHCHEEEVVRGQCQNCGSLTMSKYLPLPFRVGQMVETIDPPQVVGVVRRIRRRVRNRVGSRLAGAVALCNMDVFVEGQGVIGSISSCWKPYTL